LQDAWVGVGTGQRLLTAWAEALGVGLLGQGLGLTAEAEGEHLFGQDFADFQEEVLDVGQAGAPRGAVGAVKLIDEIFGDALDIGSHLFGWRRALFGSSHPWVLSALVSKRGSEFLSASVRTEQTFCKPCRAPRRAARDQLTWSGLGRAR
jgi:hypothetical protein